MHTEVDFPGGPETNILHYNSGALGSIPGQGTKSHMPQLRMFMPQLNIPHVARKTEDTKCHNEELAQPNKYKNK